MRPVTSGLFTGLALVSLAVGWISSRSLTAARWETPYVCYEVQNGPAPNIRVEVKDQIGSSAPLVMQAELLCNPTEKVHVDEFKPNPIKVGDHLQCYGIDSKKTGPWVVVTTQFGVNPPFHVGKAKLLCDPADKHFNRQPPDGPEPDR